MTKIFVEGRDMGLYYANMFKDEGCEIVSSIKDADLVCLIGGADVQPELYGHPNTDSHTNHWLDIITMGVIHCARMMGKPVVGICRGGQALNVYNGGTMIQHVDGHAIANQHPVSYNQTTYMVTSTHHQAMVPSKGAQMVLKTNDVAEAIAYPDCLCFQPHPEMTGKGTSCRNLFFTLIEDFLDIKIGNYNYTKHVVVG